MNVSISFVAVDFSTATLGPNEISGYVHNKNIEPLTFHPDLCFKGNLPGWMTDRPTGTSIFKTDYNRYNRPYVSTHVLRYNRPFVSTGYQAGS